MEQAPDIPNFGLGTEASWFHDVLISPY